jgi:uncharacterized protein involved in exopolysaccharide biosynthesis
MESDSKKNGWWATTEVIEPEVSTTMVRRPATIAAGRRNADMVSRLRYIWARRLMLARFAFCGMVLSAVVAFLIPKRYDVVTRLMPPDQQSGAGMALLSMLSGKTGPNISAMAGDLLGVKSAGSLFIGVLKSATVADRLTDRFDLRKVYGVKYQDDVRKALANHSDITEDKRSGVISIEVRDRDPQRAAGMAAAYVEELDRLMAQLNTGAAHRERVFLEDRLQKVSAQLEKNEKNFGEFASKNSTIDVREQGKAMMDAAATVAGQLIAAQSELEGLRQIYSDSNVRVRSVNARIQALERRMGELSNGSTPGKDGNQPKGDFEQLFPSIKKLPLLGITYADLYRQTKVQEVVFEVLTQQYELAKVQEAKETPVVRVLDAAKVPDHKAFPSRLLIILIGTCASIVAGVMWSAGRERWHEIDDSDARKVFVAEVWRDVQTDVREARRLRNGLDAQKEGSNGENGDLPLDDSQDGNSAKKK